MGPLVRLGFPLLHLRPGNIQSVEVSGKSLLAPRSDCPKSDISKTRERAFDEDPNLIQDGGYTWCAAPRLLISEDWSSVVTRVVEPLGVGSRTTDLARLIPLE